MAKVSASAPASGQAARATPDAESATAAAKTTRATRGQSREPQQNQRRSARNARSASVEGETSPAQVVKNATETGMCKHSFLENNPIPSTLAIQTLPTLNPPVYHHSVVRRRCCCISRVAQVGGVRECASVHAASTWHESQSIAADILQIFPQ